MKKILFFAAFATMTIGAQAQQKRQPQKTTEKREMRKQMSPQERAGQQAEMMQKRLRLTDEQTAKIRDINLNTMPEKDMAAEHKEMRQERMAIMKKREEAYQQVLSKDQLAEFREMKEDRMDKMKARRADRKKGHMNNKDMKVD